ncbi:MAG: hypothetical protein KI790_10900 [Cyclobacteriaceae bacterium]|nr:hypothetical protein [Cyclobacteriaceae bacterium HetDA_MAG_MS6]
MKNLLLVTCLFTSMFASAQTPDVLFDNRIDQISGFGGPMFSFSSIAGEVAPYSGGGGAVLFDNTWYVGGYGLSLAEDQEISIDNAPYEVAVRHGGLYFGYIHQSDRLVHFGISQRMGWGEITFREKPFDRNNIRENDQVFVTYPQIEVEMNMTQWFKVNVNAGYQFTVGVDNAFYDRNDLNGAAFGFSFLFGWFN